ncbi:hypothetical protein IJ21_46480 [Paenibacillus sp. 32O-W]|nr:hypothetical protein IJ21_46480 [Paenibacillus sp. 32O-W]
MPRINCPESIAPYHVSPYHVSPYHVSPKHVPRTVCPRTMCAEHSHRTFPPNIFPSFTTGYPVTLLRRDPSNVQKKSILIKTARESGERTMLSRRQLQLIFGLCLMIPIVVLCALLLSKAASFVAGAGIPSGG